MSARGKPIWALLGIAAFVGIAIAHPAFAELPQTGLGFNARMVSDDELGEMRGRLVDPLAVRFFGIQLASFWETGDGVALTATLEFHVEFEEGSTEPVGGTPTLTATWMHGCGGCGDASVEIPANQAPEISASFTAEGLTSVNGAVQSVEISGVDSNVLNDMSVRIGTYLNAESAGFDGEGEAITETRTITYPDDDDSAIQIEIDENSVGLALLGPNGTDIVMQSVNGSVANQIGQHVDITSNGNSIVNIANVLIGIDELLVNQRVAVENALGVMKGIEF